MPILRKLIRKQLGPEELELAEATKLERGDLYDKLRLEHGGLAEASDLVEIAAAEAETEFLTWTTMVREAERMLVSAGINPAGPGPSVAHSDGDRPWYRAYEPPPGGDWKSLDGETAR